MSDRNTKRRSSRLDHNRAKELFLAAFDLPPQKRAAYLDAHCQDPELRREVESLLHHHDSTKSLPNNLVTNALTPNPPPDDLAGMELQELVAHGGMGVVYKAHDPELGRSVAIKIIDASLPHSGSALERFEHEAKSGAKLNHPNIAKVYSTGFDRGFHYIVMEFVSGVTLTDYSFSLRREWATSEAIIKLARVYLGVIEAIGHAHEHGIVHRDIKPSNLIVTPEGHPYLLDFGIARTETLDLTQTGDLLGTPPYMSPEQARVKQRIDHRTDIFSFGVVMYEGLSGAHPFRRESLHQTIDAILNESPDKLGEDLGVPPDLGRICYRAMRKRAGDRYQSANELSEDLQRFLEGQPVPYVPAALKSRVSDWARRHKVGLTVGATVLAVSSIGAGYTYSASASKAARKATHGEVHIDAAGARIAAYRLDHQGIILEQVDFDRWLDPGQYRLQFSWDDGRSHETTITARASERVTLSPNPVRHDLEGMTLIQGGAFKPWGAPSEDGEELMPINVEPFYISNSEITIGQFRAYLMSSGDPYRPPGWPEGDTSHDDKAITGVTLQAAQRYAGHYGMRVPTLAEMEFVYQGTNGDTYPWGNEERELRLRPEGHPLPPMSGPASERYESVRHVLWPADQPEGDVSRDGLFHLFRNAGEMTETLNDTMTTAYFLPGCYHMSLEVARQYNRSRIARPYDKGSDDIGFRCAISASIVNSD